MFLPTTSKLFLRKHRRIHAWAPAILAASAIVAGCHAAAPKIAASNPPRDPATGVTPLPDLPATQTAGLVGTWKLDSVAGKPAAQHQLEHARMVLQADGRVQGTTGCNRFMGRYAGTGADGLEFGSNLGLTRMACPMQEHVLLQALTKTRHYRVNNRSLTLLDAQNQPLANFSRPLQPD